MTDAEQHLWQRIRKKQIGGFKFRRQEPMGNYIIDFVCLPAKLIIELDGGQHTLHREYDEERTKWLESQGFRVLRFWNHEVFEDTDVVLEVIWNALHETTSPHPSPPP